MLGCRIIFNEERSRISLGAIHVQVCDGGPHCRGKGRGESQIYLYLNPTFITSFDFVNGKTFA